MANYVIPAEPGQHDLHRQVAKTGRVWTDSEIEALLGVDFEIIELKCDDVMYVEKDWDANVSKSRVNKTATSLVNMRVWGSVLICERSECRRL